MHRRWDILADLEDPTFTLTRATIPFRMAQEDKCNMGLKNKPTLALRLSLRDETLSTRFTNCERTRPVISMPISLWNPLRLQVHKSYHQKQHRIVLLKFNKLLPKRQCRNRKMRNRQITRQSRPRRQSLARLPLWRLSSSHT